MSRLVLWFYYLLFGFFVLALAPLVLMVFLFGGLMLILQAQTATGAGGQCWSPLRNAPYRQLDPV